MKDWWKYGIVAVGTLLVAVAITLPGKANLTPRTVESAGTIKFFGVYSSPSASIDILGSNKAPVTREAFCNGDDIVLSGGYRYEEVDSSGVNIIASESVGNNGWRAVMENQSNVDVDNFLAVAHCAQLSK